MSERYNPEAKEAEERHQRFQGRLTALRDQFDTRNGYAKFKKIDASGAWEVNDYRGSNPDYIIKVGTGSAATVEKDQELVTEKIDGCVGVMLSGPNTNTLMHCSPGTGFAHSAPERVARDLARQLEESGIDIEGLQATIVGTMGRESGEFSREEEKKKWQALEDELKKAGVQSSKIVEVPVTTMSLYYSPEKKGKLFVIGMKAGFNEDGKYTKDNRGFGETREFWISLDPNVDDNIEIIQPKIKIEEFDDEDDGPYKFTFS